MIEDFYFVNLLKLLVYTQIGGLNFNFFVCVIFTLFQKIVVFFAFLVVLKYFL